GGPRRSSEPIMAHRATHARLPRGPDVPSSSRAWPRAVSVTRSPASMRAISSTRASPASTSAATRTCPARPPLITRPAWPAPPARHGLELRPLTPDPEYGALHSERPQLSLHGRSQALRRSPPPLGERGGRLGQLGMELAQPPLLRGEDLLVAREAVELGGDLVAELEHRLLGVAVLPLEAREGVEPLVDPLESARLERHARA